MKISAVVLTKNEEEEIKRCLASISWCDELLVVDDYSKDKTRQIARKSGAKIFKHALGDDFSKQRNFALKKAKGDWVLFIDADEQVSPELKDEIKQFLNSENLDSGEYSAFFIPRKDFFIGKWLQYGEAGKIKLLRLAKKGAGKWEHPVHEVWKTKGKIGSLKNPILHYSHSSIGEFLKDINYYTTIRAKELFSQNKKTNAFLIILYPLAKFFINYFLKLGFLDGVYGLVFACLMSFHSFLVRAKLFLLCKR